VKFGINPFQKFDPI